MFQVLIALFFFANGSFQLTLGDAFRIHKSTVGRIISRVAGALRRRQSGWIKFRAQDAANEQKNLFFSMACFPNVIGCIDGTGTHVPIRAPNINEHEYVNRKNVYTINVQIVCDAQLRILNSVVKYAGKRVLRNYSL